MVNHWTFRAVPRPNTTGFYPSAKPDFAKIPVGYGLWWSLEIESHLLLVVGIWSVLGSSFRSDVSWFIDNGSDPHWKQDTSRRQRNRPPQKLTQTGDVSKMEHHWEHSENTHLCPFFLVALIYPINSHSIHIRSPPDPIISHKMPCNIILQHN